MCSRYYVELSPELRPIIEAARHSSLAAKMVHDLGRPVVTEGEVRPTDIAPVIASNKRGQKTVFPMIWGFQQAEQDHTKRSQPLINARSETAASKPTFRECWLRRRCVVPASWYFEWEHLVRPDGTKRAGDKYIIQPEGASITYFAGLYRMENGFPCFTILTRQPGREVEKLHDRMPLILPPDAIDQWISPQTPQELVREISAHALTDMVLENSTKQGFLHSRSGQQAYQGSFQLPVE